MGVYNELYIIALDHEDFRLFGLSISDNILFELIKKPVCNRTDWFFI